MRPDVRIIFATVSLIESYLGRHGRTSGDDGTVDQFVICTQTNRYKRADFAAPIAADPSPQAGRARESGS